MKLFSLLCLAALLPPAAAGAADCPRKDAAETAEDCPWAGAARLAGPASPGELEKVLSAHAPAVLEQLAADRANPALLKLWGTSINYDELAAGEIVDPELMTFLSSRAGAPAPRGRLMHAGVEHTYGYLFSLLPTKFGYKRARWVRPDVERGLGLPAGAAGPNPPEGTLLANVTCLAGGIALQDDKAASALLRKAAASCHPAAREFSAAGARRGRLTETVKLGGRTVSLRTDFVPFSSEQGGNSYLLVYSVLDSAAGSAYLVTAFPVSSSFVESAAAPAGLGAEKPVQTRYNAHVEGLTGAGKFRGERKFAWLGK